MAPMIAASLATKSLGRGARAVFASALALAVTSWPAAAIQWCSEVSGGGGFAACGDVTARDIIVGLRPAEVRDLMRELFAHDSAAVQKVEELSRQLGVTDAATRRFFAILGERQVPTEQLPERLAEIAQRHKALLQRTETIVSPDARVTELKTDAWVAIQAGDYDRAEGLLNEAKAQDLAAIERQQAVLDARKLSAADAAARNGALMMTQLRYAAAAQYYDEAVRLAPEASDYRRLAGAVALKLGYYDTAEEELNQGLRVLLGAAEPDFSRVADMLNSLAETYRLTGHYKAAATYYQQAVELWTRRPGNQLEVAVGLNNLAVLARLSGDLDAARRDQLRALDTLEGAGLLDSALGATMTSNLGKVLLAVGDYAAAREMLEKALATREAKLDPLDPELAATLNDLGLVLWRTNNYEAADKAFREAMRRFDEVLGHDHPYTTAVLNSIGLLRASEGRLAEAETAFVESRQLRQRTVGEFHPDYAVSLNNLGKTYLLQGRAEDALKLFEEAVDLCQRVCADNRSLLAWLRYNLALALSATGQQVSADREITQALQAQREVGPTGRVRLEAMLRGYADRLQQDGRADEARRFEELATAGGEHLL
jgi:tetratricopeptide (TPR) repeat protein